MIDFSLNTLFITFTTFSHTYSVDQSPSEQLSDSEQQNKPFKLTRERTVHIYFQQIRYELGNSDFAHCCSQLLLVERAQKRNTSRPDSFFESGRLVFKTVAPTANVCWRYAYIIRLRVLSRPLARRPTKVA